LSLDVKQPNNQSIICYLHQCFIYFKIGTNEQLTWLQSVKKSHGSVEVSSLAQAEAINTSGIYQVGNLTNNGNVRRTVS
jgi:hypothetical protein